MSPAPAGETGTGTDTDTARRVAAIWRIEGARIVATLARVVGDLPTAEDLAQDAVAEALAQWPRDGVPTNPGAWLTAVAKRRAIDGWRRERLRDEKYVVELNRAVAVSMASGPREGLAIVDALAAAGALRGSHLIPSVRGELLSRLGRTTEARSELRAAAGLTRNEREAALLRRKADALPL